MEIRIKNLSKTYLVPVKGEGLKGSLKNLVRPVFREVRAVTDLSFAVEPGEAVGFLGPNGAGKTTTLKMLAGLLWPSGGEARVLGYVPWQRKKDYLRQLGFVMGNRSQLWWDIPARDSFHLNRDIYQLGEGEYRRTLGELSELLGVEALLEVPVRNLSLGERMKMELIGALLHAPRILFLDEPTIGLDVIAQDRLRSFLKVYRERFKVTMLVTSHYLADISALCSRVVVIDQGGLTYDGPLAALGKRLEQGKLVEAVFAGSHQAAQAAEVLGALQEGVKLKFSVARKELADALARLAAFQPVDISVQEPPLEEALAEVYRGVR